MHADRIRRYLVFKVPRVEDAEELTSEVFLRGWEYMTSSSVDNAGAFFYRIARNLVADFYRRNPPIDEISEKAFENIAATDELEENVSLKVESDVLIEKIKSLKDEYKEVLIMRYVSEMSVGEIASSLEKTPNNVRVLLHRAKKALQEIA